MITISSELNEAIAMLAEGDCEEFIGRFWVAENVACDNGYGPCARTLLDAWLLNGFKFALDFMSQVESVNGLDPDTLTAQERRQWLSVDASAFLSYCDHYGLSPRAAFAMWPEPFRAKVVATVETFARTDLKSQARALKIAQWRFVGTFDRLTSMDTLYDPDPRAK